MRVVIVALVLHVKFFVYGEAQLFDGWKRETLGLRPPRSPSISRPGNLRWNSEAFDYEFVTDASRVVANVSGFWRSSGFCPPDPHQKVCDWLHSSSVVQDIAFIGAVPFSGIQQIRVHWLLDSISITSVHGNKTTYNFTCLDDFIEILFSNGLYPGFEIMGNPSNYFTDFENHEQVVQWKNFIQDLATHYIDQYGLGFVSKWNFESWNEPRKKAFDGLNMTLNGFLNYYDATAEGLRQASALLRFGGPGGECPEVFDTQSYCWALLDHAANGVNYFTGKKDVQLDFISIHKKGLPPENVAIMMQKEKKFISILRHNLPTISTKPIYNDEADPQVTWSADREWQADVTYAAMATKTVVEHLQSTDINIHVLSNDNAFLSYQPYPFTQRTLLARFQVNTTSPPHVQFIRKPIYAVMGMLSLLGEQLLLKTPAKTRHFCSVCLPDTSLANLSIIATVHEPVSGSLHDSWRLTIIVYFSKDTIIDSEQVEVSIIMQSLPVHKDLTYVIDILDNVYSNPFAFWKFSGRPATPDWNVFQEMRNFEEPVRIKGPVRWPSLDDHGRINLTMRHPSVALIHFCSRIESPPNQVTNVVLYNITFGEVLIVWDDSCVSSKCIKTYEVEFSRVNQENLFRRINPRDSYFTSFVFFKVNSTLLQVKESPTEETRGFYRVRAVDYWGRPGPYSLVTSYP